MAINNVLASIAVKDLAASVKWYQKLFGRAPDSRPMPEVAEWRFAGGGWLQVYHLAERAGSGSFTLAVTDLDEQVAHVKKMGVETTARTESEKVRTLMITDPDGNHIAFAETADASMAQ